MQSALTPGMRPLNRMHTARPSDDFWEDDKFEDLAYSAGVNVLDADAMAEARNLVGSSSAPLKATEHECICISRGNQAEILCTCGEFTTGDRDVITAVLEATMHRTLAENEKQLLTHCSDSDMTVGAA